MNTQPLFKTFVRELRVNYGVVSYTDCNKVSSSLDASNILRDVWGSDLSHREAFYILCLNVPTGSSDTPLYLSEAFPVRWLIPR